MGGKIFQQGLKPISTPRMPRDVYEHMRKYVLDTLEHLESDRIAAYKTPVPAPGKELFGDIDVLVYKTLGAEESKDGKPDFRPLFMQLQQAFGAVQMTRTTSDFSASYAIPWPTKFEVPRGDFNKSLNGLNLAPEHHFVQVDVKVTNSKALFDWQYVVDSHSGPFMFLGPSLDAVCLKGEQKGFFLRVEEMKDAGIKSGSFVHLTCDPKEVCDIVGWDHKKLTNEDGFKNLNELFHFITSSKYFDPKAYKLDKLERAAGKGSASSSAVSEGSFNSNEGNKERREPLKTWYEYFVPTTIENPSYRDRVFDIYQIREEMFARFPHARGAYNAILNKFLAERRDAMVRRAIKKGFPGQSTAVDGKMADQHVHRFAAAGLKELLLGDGCGREDVLAKSKTTQYPLPDLPDLDPRREDNENNEKLIYHWVKDHWKEVGEWKMWAARGDALFEPKTKTTVSRVLQLFHTQPAATSCPTLEKAD